MTPTEALNLLDRVASNFDGKRIDHANLQNAVLVLRGFIETNTPKEEAKPETEKVPEESIEGEVVDKKK